MRFRSETAYGRDGDGDGTRQKGRGVVAKNGVVNYFSKCSRSDSRLSFLPRPFRVEASRGRWLFQFPGVPTRLNFYRRRRRRRRRGRRWLAADHFARYRVTGLCLRKWLRASRFFSVMLSLRSRRRFLSLLSFHAPTFPFVSLFLSIYFFLFFSLALSLFLSLAFSRFPSVSSHFLYLLATDSPLCSIRAKPSFGETNRMNRTSKALTLID